MAINPYRTANMNLHTPERGKDETREAYVARRKASNEAAKRGRFNKVTNWPTAKPSYGKSKTRRLKSKKA